MNMYEMYLPSLFVLFTANDVMAGMAMIWNTVVRIVSLFIGK